MKTYQRFALSIILIFVILLSGFALLPLAMSTQAFSSALPIDTYETAYMARCYVDRSAIGFETGASWLSAYRDLQDALNNNDCHIIWVAGGTYKPGTLREDTFTLRGGIEVYGGFAGNETQVEQRDWKANRTILSGEIGGLLDVTDNSYNVVTAVNLDSEAVLDGFTITGGHANQIGGLRQSGGGLNISEGLEDTDGYLKVVNVKFDGNYAFNSGAGLYNSRAEIYVINSTFLNNDAGGGGGGMATDSGPAMVVNTIFDSNTSGNFGGGISITHTTSDRVVILTNTIFYGNGANRGGGIYADGNEVHILNSILWANTSDLFNRHVYAASPGTVMYYDMVQGGCPTGSGVTFCQNEIPGNPQFVDAAAGNFRQLPGSPAINSGYDTMNGVNRSHYDLDGNPRIVGSHIDLGAYEFQGRCYVKWDAAGDNNGTSWTDAFVHLSSAMPYTNCDEIWVAEGTYKPILKPTDTDRTASFGLRYGMAVYGGFVGTETQLIERDWKAHPTILSGEIGDENIQTDNSYHVVTVMNTDPAATLDGFTITGGHADEPGAPAAGGGMKAIASKLNLDNIIFEDNYASSGGGLNAVAGSTDLNNVTFRRNSATSDGGGMNISGGRAWMVDSTFIDNTALYYGGGMNIDGADTHHMVNALFSRNTAAWGGGMSAVSATGGDEFILVNGTFSGNHAYASGGGVYGSGIAANLHNTILWGNTATGEGPQIYSFSATKPILFYSLVQGGCNAAWFTCETNIITSDPLFVNASHDNLRLPAGSPAIDAGNKGALFLLVTEDMDGKPRIMGWEVDLGPYEFLPKVYMPAVLR